MIGSLTSGPDGYLGPALMELFGPAGTLRAPFTFICICLALDILLGDPQYRLHPIRLAGRVLAASEHRLRKAGLDGRAGGFMLARSKLVQSFSVPQMSANAWWTRGYWRLFQSDCV